jgi:uridine phosphorylase
MESSALYCLGKLLGHKPLTICVVIANRPNKIFSKNYHTAIDELINLVLERVVKDENVNTN